MSKQLKSRFRGCLSSEPRRYVPDLYLLLPLAAILSVCNPESEGKRLVALL